MLEIIRAIFRPEIIAPIMVFAIPLSAIIGSFYVKIQKMRLEQAKLNDEDTRLIKRALIENQELKERVGNLETIITGLDKEILALKALDSDKERVKQISEQMRKS
jgi:hypothetical protein